MPDMNTLFEFRRYPGWQAKASLVCLAFVLASVAGCGKSNTPTTSAAPPPSDVTRVSPAPSPQPAANSQPAAATTPDVPKPEMQAMNRALIVWMRTNGRRPKTFQEFAGSTDFQIPTPPPGKKYAFNARGFIVLKDASSN
jgi:hypothetical protein